MRFVDIALFSCKQKPKLFVFFLSRQSENCLATLHGLLFAVCQCQGAPVPDWDPTAGVHEEQTLTRLFLWLRRVCQGS